MARNPIQQNEIDERIGKAADRFWSAFQMTENGKVKSTLLLYSFCLCWLFLLVYGLCFALLSAPLDALLLGMGAPVPLINAVEALAPAILGTAICCLVWRLPGDRRLLPAAFLWLAALMLACLITLLILMGWEGAGVVFPFFGMFVLAPLALGCGASWFLYYRHWKKRLPVTEPEPWERQ